MQDHIFRMYDIRGVVGTELFVQEVYDCARAFALYAVQALPSLRAVAVGMDGRLHSPEIKNEFVRGLRDSGLSVIDIGMCPTPLVSFAEYALPVQAACMITASHNPKEYNGIKFFLDKKPLFNKELQQVHRLFKAREHRTSMVKGSCKRHDLIPEYISLLKRLFPHLVGTSLPVVFDCGNGATGTVMPTLCQVFEFSHATLLYADVDGTYPHHEADPSVEENMQDLAIAVRNYSARIGIAFDGDGDRMGAVTVQGTVVPGDTLLGFMAQPLVDHMPDATIVCDAKCSSALQEHLKKSEAHVRLSPSGHAFIRQMMEKEQALIGGELSCHFFFKDRYFGYDDGVYAALRVIERLVANKDALELFLSDYPKRISSPELRITCAQGEGVILVDALKKKLQGMKDLEISTVDGVRIMLSQGWGIVRASNTQPVVCVRFESDTQEGIEQVRSFFTQLLLPWYTESFLEHALRW